MKRSQSPSPTPSESEFDIDVEQSAPTTPARSPKKAKTSPAKPATPKSTPTKKALPRAEPTSEKGKLVAMIIAAGTKGLDKNEAERVTGLKPAQIKQLLRADGKGGLYNSLMRVAEGM